MTIFRLGIFLAGAYDRRLELLEYQKDLRELGYKLTSRWVDGLYADATPETPDELSALNRRCAASDVDDMDKAYMLVCFTRNGPQPGSGHHVEYGYAMARHMRIILIGPRVNIYHYHPLVRHYDSYEGFRDWMASQKKGDA